MEKALKTIYEALDSKKAIDINILDISAISSFTNYFIICSGANEKHIQSLCDEVRDKVKKEHGIAPSHIEGYSNAEWILMDYFDFIVHIFSIEAREFYELEKFWSDSKEVDANSLSL